MRFRVNWILFVIFVIMVLFVTGWALGQATMQAVGPQSGQTTRTDPPGALTPSPDQAKDLKIAQQAAVIARQDVVMAQQQLQAAQQKFQATMNDLNAAANKVKADNKWGDDVEINLDTLTFSRRPKPPVPAEPKK